MSVKVDLKDDILRRYNNIEYHDNSIVETYVTNTNPEIVAIEKDFVLNYLSQDSDTYKFVEGMDVPTEIVLEDADELAQVLETGVTLIDENNNSYYLEPGFYNQYRVLGAGSADCKPIDEEWSVADGDMKFRIR